MKDPMQPIDLRESVLLGIEHICNSVDRERDCRPYFRFNLISTPVWSQHEARRYTTHRWQIPTCTQLMSWDGWLTG